MSEPLSVVSKAQPVDKIRELEESLEGKGYLDAGDIVVLQMKLNAIRQDLEFAARERLGYETSLTYLKKENANLKQKIKKLLCVEAGNDEPFNSCDTVDPCGVCELKELLGLSK